MEILIDALELKLMQNDCFMFCSSDDGTEECNSYDCPIGS